MRLNVQTDYALRVLMHVALQNGERVRMGDIAQNFGISHNHLTKVVHRLSTLGYLKTFQGRNGGMCLAKSAEEVSVGQVVREFEPDFKLVECMNPASSRCRIQHVCVLQGELRDALREFLERLDRTTLGTLIGPYHKLQTLLDLPIKQIISD